MQKKEESIFKDPVENEKLKIEEERNQKVINEISNILENSIDANYSFTYTILIDDVEYNYEGQKFENIIKGNYYTHDENINYQIENNTVSFALEDNFITEINFDNGKNIIYSLNYNNFNNINYIEKINYEKTKVEYRKSSSIDKQTFYNELNHIYYIYSYYIKDVTMEINGQRNNIIDTSEVFEKAMYNINYNKEISPEKNIQQINRFIFDNEFNIIAIKNNENIWSYYLTIDEYVNNILNEYVNFN